MGKRRHRSRSKSVERFKKEFRDFRKEFLQFREADAGTGSEVRRRRHGSRTSSPPSSRHSREIQSPLSDIQREPTPDRGPDDGNELRVNTPPPTELETTLVPPEVLSLLGEVSEPQELEETPILEEVSSRWSAILRGGLPSTVLKEIQDKYPSFKNCQLAQAPQLNTEVRVTVKEAAQKRDDRLAALQSQLGVSLSALGRALSLLIEGGGADEATLSVIGMVSDASRLIADLHHANSKTRRALILPELNEKIRKTLNEAPLDGWLFGNNLGDRVAQAKALEKSCLDLKPPPARTVNFNSKKSTNLNQKQSLNFKGPARQTWKGRWQAGQQKTTHSPARKSYSGSKHQQQNRKRSPRRSRKR